MVQHSLFFVLLLAGILAQRHQPLAQSLPQDTLRRSGVFHHLRRHVAPHCRPPLQVVLWPAWIALRGKGDPRRVHRVSKLLRRSSSPERLVPPFFERVEDERDLPGVAPAGLSHEPWCPPRIGEEPGWEKG